MSLQNLRNHLNHKIFYAKVVNCFIIIIIILCKL